MPKRFYSKKLNADLVVPDDFTDAQIAEYEASLIPPSAGPMTQVGAFFSGIPAGVVRAITDIPEGVGAVTGIQSLRDMGKGMRQSDLARYFTDTPQDLQGAPTARMAGEVAGNMLSFLTPGAVLKAPKLARGLTALMSASMGASEQAQESERMEATPGQQQAAAALGSVVGLADLLPLGRLAKSARGLNMAKEAATKSALGSAAKTAAAGFATEGGQKIGQNAIERAIYNEGQGLGEGVGTEATAGGIAEGTLDLLLGLAAGKAGRNIMARREAKGASPIIERGAEDAIGTRRGVDGESIIEFLQRTQPETSWTAGAGYGYAPVQGAPPVVAPASMEHAMRILARGNTREGMEDLTPPPPLPAPQRSGSGYGYPIPPDAPPVDAPPISAAVDAPLVPPMMPGMFPLPAGQTRAGQVVSAPPPAAPKAKKKKAAQAEPDVQPELAVAPEPGKEVVQPTIEPPVPAAPLEQRLPDNAVFGRRAPAKTARGYKVGTQFAVVPMESLRISNSDMGDINPDYPADLQPRQRDRKTSDEQIHEIIAQFDPDQIAENYLATDGAPIIGEDMAVESGNGRSMALRRIYQTQKHSQLADTYRQWIKDNAAERFGLDPEAVAGIQNPVLVRVRRGDLPQGVTRTDWGRDANERTTASMSPAEQAAIDAKAMTPEILASFRPGDVGGAENYEFVRNFIEWVVPQPDRGAMRAGDGALSTAGARRIQAAIFARAYGDRGMIERMSEDPDDNIKSVVGAMVNVAPRFISMRSAIDAGSRYDLDISKDLVSAASTLSALRAEKRNVKDFLNQENIAERVGMETHDAILLTLADLGKNKAKFGDMLNLYLDAVDSIGDPNQSLMFGAPEVPTPKELWSAIVKREYGQGASDDPGVNQLDPAGADAPGGVVPGQSAGEESGKAAAAKFSAAAAAPKVADSPFTVRSLRKEVEAGTKPAIALDLFKELQDLGVDDLVSTRLIDSMPQAETDGSYANRIITLAMAGKDRAGLLKTLNHEVVHAMREMGLFTDGEWKLLTMRFTPSMLSAEDRKFYPVSQQVEEAVARGMEQHADSRIVQKKLNQLDAIAQVIEKYRAGEIGSREIKPPVQQQSADAEPRPAEDEPAALAIEDLISESPEDAETSGPKFSVKKQLPVVDPVFAPPDDRSPLRKDLDELHSVKDFNKLVLRARQTMVDMRAAIEDASRKSKYTSADVSADAAVRVADRAGDLGAAALESGPIVWTGTHFEASNNPSLAPKNILTEAYNAGKLDRLFHYIAGERAADLVKDQRERLMTPTQIATFRGYGSDPEIKKWADRWKGFNDAMVDALQASGRIDKAAADKFKKAMYLPFYRVQDTDGTVTFQRSGTGLASNPRLQKLKGGKEKIADPVDNIVRNVTTLTQMMTKNVAMQRAIRDGVDNGVVKPVKESGTNTVKVWENGKEKHYAVEDPVLLQSMMASQKPLSNLMRMVALPSGFLRSMVTHAPPFMIRNALRDSLMAWEMGYTKVPFANIIPSAIDAIREAPNFKKLERMAVVGTGIRGEGGDSTQKNLRKAIEGRNTWVDALRNLSGKSEAITRLTIYDAVKKRGGSDAQAAHEAREFLNFQRRGAEPVIQAFNSLVPFQNARWQGNDVLLRTVMQGGANQRMRRQLIARGLTTAGLSTIYTILASGTKAWQNASAEDRDNHWILATPEGEGIKVPIPFELGYFTKIVPERLTATLMGEDTGREFLSAFRRFFFNTIKADPIPQGLAPLAEVSVNYDRFRDRPIEPEYMKKRESADRFDERTSELAKQIGKYTDILSPLQIDHILRGYTGSIGTYTNMFLSHLIKGEGIDVANPHDIPMIGTLFQRPDGPKRLIDFYELNQLAEQAANALRTGAERTPERDRLAQIERRLRPIEQQMRNLTSIEKSIRKDQTLTAAQRRAGLEEIRRRKIAITEPIKGLRQ